MICQPLSGCGFTFYLPCQVMSRFKAREEDGGSIFIDLQYVSIHRHDLHAWTILDW